MHNLTKAKVGTELEPSFNTQNQVHNGIINKREEPYKTMLRSRARDYKLHSDRFIVLGDADPRHVEERLGGELMSNQIIKALSRGG